MCDFDSKASRFAIRERSTALAAFALAVLATMPASADGDGNSVHGQVNSAEGMMLTGDMAPEPDYEAVMAKEFRGAVAEGTRTALIRFIARHPGHPLADRARAMLAEHGGSQTGSSQDPDADIYADFDDARRQDTAAAYNAFVRQYPDHPLAAEARQRLSIISHGN